MAERNDGGSAFPHPEERVNFDDSVGMTLRDYFAAAYLNGAASNPNCGQVGAAAVAKAAYVIADAMLKAREAK